MESWLQVTRVGIDTIQAITLILNVINELWQVLISQVFGIFNHLVFDKVLGRVSIILAYLLIARDLRWPLTRMWPGIENRLVRNSSLLSHLEQCLFRHIALGCVILGNITNLLVAVEFLSSFVFLNDSWWIHLHVFWFLLKEEALWQVLLMSLEGSEVFN